MWKKSIKYMIYYNKKKRIQKPDQINFQMKADVLRITKITKPQY